MRVVKIAVSLLFVVGLVLQSGCGNSESPLVDQTQAASVDTVPMGDADQADPPAAPTLFVGSVAPALNLPTWISGDEVSSLEPGKTYVVEFWATWCGPCRTSMPHISQLQEDYGDAVTFIGISDEDQETVDAFFAKEHDDERTWGDVVTYSIAIDPARQAHRDYMRAAGQSGIPTAFVVGPDGMIEWIGHPMGIDEPLAKITDGSWDREAELARQQAEVEAEAKMKQVASRLRQAQADGDYDAALGIIDEIIADSPNPSRFKMAKVGLLMEAGRADEAQPVLAEIGEDNWDDSMFLNGLAWSMATQMDDLDLEMALKFAMRANELTADKDASILDTVARIHYEQGNLEQAIEWQTKAAEQSPELKSTLEKYQAELEGETPVDDAGADADAEADAEADVEAEAASDFDA
jgi:thiol-disulfide isomerase/thioredoxin